MTEPACLFFPAVSSPPNMKTILAGIFFAALCSFAAPALYADGWTTHYDEAVQKAQSDDKAVLLNFTGSDWCPWCIKMKQETLDTGAFHAYANDNLELVEVDFPNAKPQSDQVKAQNAMLQKKFKVDGFPTFVILSKDGRVLGKQVGYLAGGPTAFIAFIQKHYKAPARTGGGSGTDFDSVFHQPVGSSTQ